MTDSCRLNQHDNSHQNQSTSKSFKTEGFCSKDKYSVYYSNSSAEKRGISTSKDMEEMDHRVVNNFSQAHVEDSKAQDAACAPICSNSESHQSNHHSAKALFTVPADTEVIQKNQQDCLHPIQLIQPTNPKRQEHVVKEDDFIDIVVSKDPVELDASRSGTHHIENCTHLTADTRIRSRQKISAKLSACFSTNKHNESTASRACRNRRWNHRSRLFTKLCGSGCQYTQQWGPYSFGVRGITQHVKSHR